MFSSPGSKSAQRKRIFSNNGLVANIFGLFVKSNNGIVSNSSGIFVNANTGVISNLSGVFVDNSVYPNTINLSNNLSNYDTRTNLLLNGNMEVWQRGTGTATINTSSSVSSGGFIVSGNGYVADCWQVVTTGASVTASIAAGRLNSYQCMQVNGATSHTALTIKQRMEALQAAYTANQQITVQAYIYNGSGASITPTLTIKYPTATDNWTSTSTLINANNLQVCPDASWTQVAFAFASNTTANAGMEVSFSFGALNTTSKYVRIGECAMTITPNIANGTVSSPPTYPVRVYPEELMLSRRHCFAGGGGYAVGVVNTSYVTASIKFPVKMRATPTVVLIATPTIQPPGSAASSGSTTLPGAFSGTASGGRIDIQSFSPSISPGNQGDCAILTTDPFLAYCEL